MHSFQQAARAYLATVRRFKPSSRAIALRLRAVPVYPWTVSNRRFA